MNNESSTRKKRGAFYFIFSHRKRFFFSAFLVISLFIVFRFSGFRQSVNSDAGFLVKEKQIDEEKVVRSSAQLDRDFNQPETQIDGGKISENNVSLLLADRSRLLRRIRSQNVLVRNKALDEFKEYLLINDTRRAQELLMFLQDVEGRDDSFGPLVATIAVVGTPELQGVLRQVLTQRNNDWDSYSAIVSALGGLPAPTVETIALLQELSRDVDPDFSSTAALALGGSMHALAKTQPDRVKRLLDPYISQLENPNSDPDQLKESLGVLGNAGLESTTGIILSLTRHPRADVRAEAVMTLRGLLNPSVELRLMQIFEEDPEVDVRLRVLDALAFVSLSSNVKSRLRSCIESAEKCSAILREKSIELLTNQEFELTEKQNLRIWFAKLYEVEPNGSMKLKLQEATRLFSGR